MWRIMEKWVVAKKGETVLDVALDAMIALLGASMLTQALKLIFSVLERCERRSARPISA